MIPFLDYAQQIYDRCQQLATYSQDPNCVDRRYLTAEHKAANQCMAKWMQEAGMDTWQDDAGNQWGRYPSANPDASSLIIGSHLDTVPNAGKYDGILGVVLPVTLMQLFKQQGQTFPFHIDIVGFGDEEGTRFGTTLLGSCAVAGSWQARWAALCDENGISLAKAISDFGGDINRIDRASRADDRLLGYLEIHIEQGPVLEANKLPVGIVTAIAGAKRFAIQVTGHAGHAGTVPMSMRQDALSAAAEMLLAIEALASENGIVATVGKITARPGAVNVIPGFVEFSLDIRSEDDALRDSTLTLIQTQLGAIAEKRHCQISWQSTHAADAVLCDKTMQAGLEQAIRKAELEPFYLPSGAGHDAMAIAPICPVAMLFTRCERGISHHPAEAIDVADVEHSLKVIYHYLTDLNLTH